MVPQQIFMLLSADDKHARGNIWKLTAKKTDFYLDFEGHDNVGFHLSIHGPNANSDGHRFHVRIDRRAVKRAREAGMFVNHRIGRGVSFDGVQVSENTYRVARIRWSWDLQRSRFKQESRARTPAPRLGPDQSGVALYAPLHPNSAWDIDIFASYGAPYWPDAEDSAREGARLGPLSNDSGMWLTATSYHRSMMKSPTPEQLDLPAPGAHETPQFVMIAGLGPGKPNDMFWFVEGITSRELASAAALPANHA